MKIRSFVTHSSIEKVGRTAGGPVGVLQIYVEGLFGQFDYLLNSKTANLSDLFILYGDNGSGKTTILKALFHLLSAGKNRGHRSAIKLIPFKVFEVCLADGTKIRLDREVASTGPYSIKISPCNGPPIHANFSTDKEREGHFATPKEEEDFNSCMSSMGLTVYFLSADRRIQSDIFPRENEVETEQQMMIHMAEEFGYRQQIRFRREDRPDDQTRAVLHALELASAWIRGQVLQAANKGTSSSHVIYAEIVKHIIAASHKDSQAERKNQVIETLQSLAARTSEYALFGFIPPLSVDEMVAAVSQSTPETISIIENVLTPYIRGTEARLKELENIHALTKQFIHNLDGFYLLKTITFDLRKGLSVVMLQNGEPLNPAWLSSGEKHLLLLFCHVLISNDKRSIFIIDEPELSLNIKWQRKLIEALLQIIGKSQSQFILATHAIELLAEHYDNVVKLEPKMHASTNLGNKDHSLQPKEDFINEPMENS